MIISHKHKFIFFKPRKVASTSIEINLAKVCGKNDIVTPISEFDKESDQNPYEHTPKNYTGLINHSLPWEAFRKIGLKKWLNYTKISVVRNPYDLVVSYYWYKTKGEIPFDKFIKQTDLINNDDFYFYPYTSFTLINQFIRYESLDKDYENLCKKLKIEYSPLPLTKNKFRSNNSSYQDIYNEESKTIIKKKYSKSIKYFGYDF